MATIEDLLKSMLTLKEDSPTKKFLPNSADTWARIGSKDSFSELGFDSDSEKKQFLKEWMIENPYLSL